MEDIPLRSIINQNENKINIDWNEFQNDSSNLFFKKTFNISAPCSQPSQTQDGYHPKSVRKPTGFDERRDSAEISGLPAERSYHAGSYQTNASAGATGDAGSSADFLSDRRAGHTA